MFSKWAKRIVAAAFVLAVGWWLFSGEDDERLFASALTEADYLQPTPLIVNPRGRDTVSLNGPWNIIIDPQDRGLPTRALGLTLPGFFENLQDTGPMELVEYRFDESEKLQVPGDWNTQREDLFWYKERVWYQRYFDVARQDTQSYHLYFGAAHYEAHVAVNGVYAGTHKGGFTPFNLDVTDLLVDGQNSVVVSVSSKLNHGTVPTANTDWFNYGGLTRDVMLVSTPSIFIQDYEVTLLDEVTKDIRVAIDLNQPLRDVPVSVKIAELNADISMTTDRDGHAEARLTAPNAMLWSPETPHLYDVTLETGGAEIQDRIGLRTIRVEGDRILLNGQPVFLRGMSAHEETTTRYGRNATPDDGKAVLSLIKELGGNYVRLAHYPHNAHTVKLADEMGLMVWSEIPVYWDVDWHDTGSLADARNQLEEMITRDRNRASVITWSIGNETPNSDARLSFMETLADHARAVDGSRPVSAALVGDEVGQQLGQAIAVRALTSDDTPEATKQAIREFLGPLNSWLLDQALAWEIIDPQAPIIIELEDPLGDSVDIVGINEYIGWYYAAFLSPVFDIPEAELREQMFELMPNITLRNAYGKPLVISETGAGAVAGRRDADMSIWSEDYQAKVYERQIEMLQNSDQLAGLSPWIIKDFRSAMRPLNGVQDFWNRKGLVSETGERKAAFHVLKAYYQGLAASEAAQSEPPQNANDELE